VTVVQAGHPRRPALAAIDPPSIDGRGAELAHAVARQDRQSG
jgi:hypothetical protein